jgi:uncharacterized repeat protein (TIGR01451 family)
MARIHNRHRSRSTARWLLGLPVLAATQVVAAGEAAATITVTTVSSTAALVSALTPNSATGVTITGTPTILGSFASNAYGTFTTSGSNLGMLSGAIFGTGNVSQVPGAPATFWDGPGTGITSGSEFDRAALTLSFIPDPGVTKVAFRYVMGSEEYNEYVGQNFSDNITIRLTGGIYANTNVAVVPGTSTGIDIDTINNGLNSAYYRDNTIASPPIPDSVLDGHTTVLSTISTVVPGTTYSAEIKVADFTDNEYNTAIFVNYFGAALIVDLDADNSSGATGSNYQTSFTEAGPAVAVVDGDRLITNLDTTSIVQAVVQLTNAKPSDSLAIGTLPAGITGTVDTSVPGVITVTLSGSSSIANYHSALSAISFSNSSNVPDTTTRNVTVVLSDGTTNSNTAVSSISITPVPTYLYTVAKSVDLAAIAAPGTLNYTITLTNTGDGAMTGVTPADELTQGTSSFPLMLTGPAGDAGTIGTFDIGEVWTYTASYAAGQARIDNGGDLVNTVSVTTAQTGAAVQQASATTTVQQTPGLSIVKSANTAGPVSVNNIVTYSYIVTNTGNITIRDITVNDVHNSFGSFPTPAGEVLNTDVAPLGDSTDAAANASWDALAPGDAIRFSAAYQVVQADIDNLQ